MSNASAAEATASKPLGRPPKQRQQRQRILNEAAKIIARVGYEECSLSRIAEGLDLSPPAIYHYFPTKQSIFSEIAMTTVKGIHEHGCDAIDVNQSFTRQLEQM
ncbi:MAG: helix-turn-helix domain-containing protein, partial [Pseudomonadota bacterium]